MLLPYDLAHTKSPSVCPQAHDRHGAPCETDQELRTLWMRCCDLTSTQIHTHSHTLAAIIPPALSLSLSFIDASCRPIMLTNPCHMPCRHYLLHLSKHTATHRHNLKPREVAETRPKATTLKKPMQSVFPSAVNETCMSMDFCLPFASLWYRRLHQPLCIQAQMSKPCFDHIAQRSC